MWCFCPEEAIQRCGSQASLDRAIEAKRVFRITTQGLTLYYFPRREFSRDQVFSQALDGSVDKGGSMNDFQVMSGEQMGFEWEPDKLIRQSGLLSSTGLASSVNRLAGASSSQPSLVDALIATGGCLLLLPLLNLQVCQTYL